MFNRKKMFLIIFAVIIALLIYIGLSLKVLNHFPSKIDLKNSSAEFGATFSKKFCEELGLNWKETYIAILDDLKVRNLRLPAYWDEIEKEEGVFDFKDFDYLVNEASKRQSNLIITLGRRQPRWPECHSPAWNNKNSQAKTQAAILKMIKVVVLRYKNYPSVVNWQVENEAFLGTFGVCPPLDRDFLQQEIDLVRSLDDRQIIITGSGEMSSWKNEVAAGDVFGTTMYRVVYNSWLGYVRYSFPVYFYQLKAKLAGADKKTTMIIELQTEPWVPEGKMIYLSEQQINRSMSVPQLKANLQYAINVDFNQIYVWGVEWWYWQKLYGNPEYWQVGKTIFN